MEEFNLHEMIAGYLADLTIKIIMGKGRNPQGACATSYERVHIHELIFMSEYSHILTSQASSYQLYVPYLCVCTEC